MLEADLEAAQARTSSDEAAMSSDLRRFQIDEERLRLEILSLRVVIETDEVERNRLDLEVERTRQLLDAGFLSQAEYDNVRLARQRVDVSLESNRNLLSQAEKEYAAARARRESFERGIEGRVETEPLLQPLRRAIEVETVRLNEIEVERKSLVLRSPVTGRVSQLLCRGGQSVVPGEPILVVTEATPHEIVAWMPETAGELEEGRRRVLVASRTDPGKVAESVVIRTSPSIRQLPERLWRNPRVPDYGRAVVVAGVPALDLTPGELVTVRFARE
jgi:multidrug resistance efflux pump